jgi:hypothetical protein
MRIVISSGHSKKVRGAAGPEPWGLDEVDEARRVVEHVADYLSDAGVGVVTYHDDVSTTQNENLNRIVDFHNSKTRDLDISVHFNAYEETKKPMGTECLYVTQEELAEKVSVAIADAGDFIDRGPKKRTDLFFLNNTEEPAILIETCFVDSEEDAGLYRQNFDLICHAIADAVAEEEIEPPPNALTRKQQAAICKIANNSDIAAYSWDDRGVAPKGFTQGMALSFAQTYNKLRVDHPAAIEMAKARTESEKDVFNEYRREFAELGMPNETSGPDTLRHLYAFMLGSGMRESGGEHCCGRDQSAENFDSDTCEAGAFQTSYNASGASSPEFDNLMDEYLNDLSAGYLEAWSEEVSCSSDDWDNYGSGRGMEFQRLCKEMPAFSAETHGLTLRNLCNHYGPVIRHEVELHPDADVMFKSVQDYVDTQIVLTA